MKRNLFLYTIMIATFLCCGTGANTQKETVEIIDINIIKTVSEVEGMAFINGGEYTFQEYNNSQKVSVQSFYIDKHPVTIADFAQFVRETGYLPISDIPDSSSLYLKKTINPERPAMVVLDSFLLMKGKGITWRHDEFGNLRDSSDWHYPVVHVSFNDAVAYAEWAGKRLPTIYEWQYVAVKGLENRRPSQFLENNAWHADNARRIMPAGLNEPNDFGVYDLIGNIGEFVDRGGHRFSREEHLPSYDRLRYYFGSEFMMELEELYPPGVAFTLNWLTTFEIGFRCAMDVPQEK